MMTRQVDLLVKGFKSGLGASFLHRDPKLAKQLYEAAREAQLYQDYSRQHAFRIHNVTLPVSEEHEGNAIACKLREFFGLKYMVIESYDVEIAEPELYTRMEKIVKGGEHGR